MTTTVLKCRVTRRALASLSDAEIDELYSLSYREEGRMGGNLVDMCRTYRQSTEQLRRHCAFVAKDPSGRVVGWALLLNGNDLCVFVRRGCKRQGVGAKLVQSVLKHATQPLQVDSHTRASDKFWQQFGKQLRISYEH